MQLWRNFARQCCCDAAAGCMNDVTETTLTAVNHVSSGSSGVGAVFLDLDVEVLSRQPAE